MYERWWAPYRPTDRALVYSVSKTFTASAIGLAVGEGRLSLDDRVADLLGVATSDDRIAALTVHHLLSMSTGHTEDTIAVVDGVPPEQWVERLLQVRPQAPVGSRHVYNNGASFLLGELVRRLTGEDLVDYLRPRLFEPLGIDPAWDTDGLGRCLGWTGLHLTIAGLAAMGELLRCDGVWQGRRLLPEGWVAGATSRQVATQADEPSGPDWTLGYGYQVWMGREGYRLDGAFGQFAFVLPEREEVIAIQSAQSCTQVLIDLVWEHLVGAVELPSDSGPGSLPVPSDTGGGDSWASAGPVPLDPAMVDAGEDVGVPPDVADLTARRDGGTLRVAMVAEGHDVELVAVPGEWRREVMALGGVPVPVAVAAGADEAGVLHARIVFTDTPHTLRLQLAPDGSAALAWRVNPLQGPSLAGMRAH